MLHIINQFPVDESVLQHTRFGDIVLFTDMAILALKKNNREQSALTKALANLKSCVRIADLSNKGMSCNEIISRVSIIDDNELQTLTEESTAIRSSN